MRRFYLEAELQREPIDASSLTLYCWRQTKLMSSRCREKIIDLLRSGLVLITMASGSGMYRVHNALEPETVCLRQIDIKVFADLVQELQAPPQAAFKESTHFPRPRSYYPPVLIAKDLPFLQVVLLFKCPVEFCRHTAARCDILCRFYRGRMISTPLKTAVLYGLVLSLVRCIYELLALEIGKLTSCQLIHCY